ncbi:MAG: hypothetical protein ACWA5W_10115 [Phycisphaerales bacterium]
MNQLLNKLFGIGSDTDPIGFGTQGARLSFVHPLESWIIMLGIIALLGVVLWTYRSLPGSTRQRGLMAIIRLCALITLFILAMGPMLERQRTRTEQDWTLVLLDQSLSMQTADVLTQSTIGTEDSIGIKAQPRIAQLRSMLNAKPDSPNESWTTLSQRKHVQWLGFSDHLTPLSTGLPPTPDQLTTTNAQSTHIAKAIHSSLALAQTHPISSIVLISDGRSVDPIDPQLLNTLTSEQIPVFVVPMGSESPIADIELTRIDTPRTVFADDRVPMRISLAVQGIDHDTLESLGLEISLSDHATGETIATAPLTAPLASSNQTNPNQLELTLNFKPEQVGNHDYTLQLVDRQGTPLTAPSPFDLNPTNNSSRLAIDVVDRPMRVLYIDGYPRWEQRYLKNLLLRESSITSSSLLLASTRRSIQEGDQQLSTLPITAEQWEPFDVIIMGDVDPNMFSQSQLDGLAEHISDHGAGLLWIAGESATPSDWFSTPIAPLLPMHNDTGGSIPMVRPWNTQITMHSTPEAVRIGLLGMNDQRNGWLDRLSNPDAGWSQLRWGLEIDPAALKPGVTTLATAQPIAAQSAERSNDPQAAMPIVTMMRFGSGRSIFVGTDEIWRWRYGRGEDLPERFWLPIIRSLGRGTIDRRANSARLSIHPKAPAPNQPAQIILDLYDQTLINMLDEEVIVELSQTNQQGPAAQRRSPTRIALRGIGATRTGTWVPDEPGIYQASIIGADESLARVTARARVVLQSDELSNLNTDHPSLTNLAEHTQGKVIAPDQFDTIPALLPNRAQTITLAPDRVSLWDRPISLILLISLLLIEWIARRTLRLI